MIFRFFTIFPELISPYFSHSIAKIALQNDLFSYEIFNLRNFLPDPKSRVDDAQIGGGAGQVMNFSLLKNALSTEDSHVIFLSPVGKKFTNFDAMRLSKRPKISLVCARYEGFDERACEIFCDEIFSIGDFILMGGELAALVVCESILRQIPGVLGNENSLLNESFSENLLQAPVFSRENTVFYKNHEKFSKFSPPDEYFSGNHARISALKKNLARLKTRYFRPDLRPEAVSGDALDPKKAKNEKSTHPEL